MIEFHPYADAKRRKRTAAIIRVRNPRTGRYVKIDSAVGRIVVTADRVLRR